MIDSFAELIRRHCRPLQPVPTEIEPKLKSLDGIRALLVDVYGTLLISASGDIGTVPSGHKAPGGSTSTTPSESMAPHAAIVEAYRAIGFQAVGDGRAGAHALHREIEAWHSRLRQAGVEFPEVDIVEVWKQVTDTLIAAGAIALALPVVIASSADLLSELQMKRLAVEYELRVNPVWAMPRAPECLAAAHRAGILLGIISNAQFLTIELCRELLQWESLGWEFDPHLRYYSYEQGRAKPDVELFRLARGELERRGLGPHQVLYIGNDMLNDICPATKVGFRTALFAGDARGLRLRHGDRRVAGLQPDLVITDWEQLRRCLSC